MTHQILKIALEMTITMFAMIGIWTTFLTFYKGGCLSIDLDKFVGRQKEPEKEKVKIEE